MASLLDAFQIRTRALHRAPYCENHERFVAREVVDDDRAQVGVERNSLFFLVGLLRVNLGGVAEPLRASTSRRRLCGRARLRLPRGRPMGPCLGGVPPQNPVGRAIASEPAAH